MKLFIAGGCGEHGRNCFYIEKNNTAILVDCGIKNGVEQALPMLSDDQIKRIKYLFITHSHADHTGALNWLYQNGFRGKVILSVDTFVQMSEKPKNWILLEQHQGIFELEKNITIEYGASGHCAGARWYEITWENKTMLFTGDYCENTNVYQCDRVIGRKADIALIDCAYGYEKNGYEEEKSGLLQDIKAYLQRQKNVLLPVPRFGRGIELIQILLQEKIENIVVDHNFLVQCREKKYFTNNQINQLAEFSYDVMPTRPSVSLICDPQLKKRENIRLAEEYLVQEDVIILTGHIDEGSYAEKLYVNHKIITHTLFVHQDIKDAINMIHNNHFDNVILTHCKNRFDKTGQPVLHAITGEWITF